MSKGPNFLGLTPLASEHHFCAFIFFAQVQKVGKRHILLIEVAVPTGITVIHVDETVNRTIQLSNPEVT
jgi:hypothetical protein